MVEQGLKIGNKTFTNRLFTGTGKFSTNAQIPEMLEASGSQMITVALRRIDFGSKTENILDFIPDNVILLPNTSGARTAEEAVRVARIARRPAVVNLSKLR